MRHCNAEFNAEDIWFLIDTDTHTNRKLYIATCPYCNKKMAIYSYNDLIADRFMQQSFYSGGATRIKEKFKKEIVSTMLDFRKKFKAPSGFKYGKNIEIKSKGKIVGIKQYACDFWGNKILVKKIENV